MGFYNRLYKRWDSLEKCAFRFTDDISYKDLSRQVSAAAWFLEQNNLSKGDVLALQLPTCSEFVFLTLAALSRGIVVLPLNPSYKEEVQYYLDDSKAKLFIVQSIDIPIKDVPICLLQDVLWQGSMEAAEVHDEDLAFLLYTSGTTGEPKGACITHKNVEATVEALFESWSWESDDRMLHVLPLFHIHGLFVGFFTALWANASVEFQKFEPALVLKRLESGQITVFMGVPTLYYRLLSFLGDTRVDVSAVRLFTSGSAPLPVQIHQHFKQTFSKTILERYGMTEVGIVLSNPYIGERRVGSVGFPIGDTVVEVRSKEENPLCDGEIGELWHKGSSVITEYLNKPQQTALTIKNNWLKSGDLGYRDQDGYFYIVGRARDLIISGGMNIYPREIEKLLLDLDGVEAVAVIGVPDLEWGERVVACLIGEENFDSEHLKKVLKETMATYKIPKEVHWMRAFPRNAMGKIQKSKLRKIFSSQGE